MEPASHKDDTLILVRGRLHPYRDLHFLPLILPPRTRFLAESVLFFLLFRELPLSCLFTFCQYFYLCNCSAIFLAYTCWRDWEEPRSEAERWRVNILFFLSRIRGNGFVFSCDKPFRGGSCCAFHWGSPPCHSRHLNRRWRRIYIRFRSLSPSQLTGPSHHAAFEVRWNISVEDLNALLVNAIQELVSS